MDIKRLTMTVLWLAALGFFIVFGGRIVGNLSSRAGV